MTLIRTPSRGFTLVELVISIAILSIGLVGIFSAMWSSMSATKRAKPRLLAKQAATRLLAELEADAGALEPFYKNYWKGDAGFPDKLSAAQIKNVGTADVYIDVEGLPSTGLLKNTYEEILAPAIAAHVMQRPTGAAPMLRLRFLSEAEYNKLWGLAGVNPVDLNFNGAFDDGIELAGGATGLEYKMFPIQVSVHWRDEGGDQSFETTTVITANPLLDAERK